MQLSVCTHTQHTWKNAYAAYDDFLSDRQTLLFTSYILNYSRTVAFLKLKNKLKCQYIFNQDLVTGAIRFVYILCFAMYLLHIQYSIFTPSQTFKY